MDAVDFISCCCDHTEQQCFSFYCSSGCVFSESEIINAFVNYAKRAYKINIVDWEPTDCDYPEYIFLGGDRGILAYIKFKYVQTPDAYRGNMIALDPGSVLETVRKANSRLDRPVFFIYIINSADIKGLYFETDEQIRDRWFNGQYCEDKYSPVLDEAGDMENLINIFRSLKQNGVKYY